ncbi:MAG: hypothetical protein J7500_15815 [Sphingomonas sp.]|uniref:hypothetical protein n=1 Tax=Sphingomonas sp. TaxID=28214 RepID=UPI001B25E873|nr:hypothetical protein [Sphingomonas sp.]MBO9624175.1 hypothetical protein [Sphingomonas sp.]
MPSPTEFSTTPADNTTIGGVNIAENCSPGGLNDVERYLAATIRVAWDAIPDANALMPKAGGAFTNQITRQGRGGYLHFSSASLTDGQVYALPEGNARPAAAEGVIVFYYS